MVGQASGRAPTSFAGIMEATRKNKGRTAGDAGRDQSVRWYSERSEGYQSNRLDRPPLADDVGLPAAHRDVLQSYQCEMLQLYVRRANAPLRTGILLHRALLHILNESLYGLRNILSQFGPRDRLRRGAEVSCGNLSAPRRITGPLYTIIRLHCSNFIPDAA